MFLKEIYLKNYKCFEEETFSFGERFTVLIGENGSGKTAVLDGIADSLRPFIGKFSNNDLVFSESSVRRKSVKLSTKKNIELVFPAEVKSTIRLNGSNVELPKVERNRQDEGFKPASSNEFRAFINHLEMEVTNGKKVVLPIVAYYKTNRLWGDEGEKEEIFPIAIGSRFNVYKDCLTPTADSIKLWGWFKRMTFIEIQGKRDAPELQVVSDAVEMAIESIAGKRGKIYFDVKSDELIIDIGNGIELPMQMLSDGYRNTLGMIADIAYRMAELNPHVTTDTPGIVLIDEIDLHLHPKWQRSIVGDLKRIFPNCQFIVTTHSPFIIQSLKATELIRLDEEELIEKDPFRESIEEVTENYMGVEDVERSEKFKTMEKTAAEYFSLVAKGQGEKNGKRLQSLKSKLDELELQYSDDPAYVALMKAERASQHTKLGIYQLEQADNLAIQMLRYPE